MSIVFADQQCAKGIVLHSMRLAVRDLWGEEGLADVAARLSADAREHTYDAAPSPLAWYPERFLVEWQEGVWSGPAKRDDDALCKCVDRRMDFGFGRVRKALLGLVGPAGVVRRATDLWRHDHTHGTLTMHVEKEEQASSFSVSATLSDHLFCETPIARRCVAEVYRYAVQLSRGAKNVTQTHALQEGKNGAKNLFVRIAWE